MLKKNTDHIIVISTTQESGYFKCNRCGAELPYKLPVSVTAWVKLTRKFMKAHWNCQPAEKTDYMSFTFPCLICGEDCVPAPNIRGWFSVNVASHSKRVHFDCADWLKESADQIRNAPVLGED